MYVRENLVIQSLNEATCLIWAQTNLETSPNNRDQDCLAIPMSMFSHLWHNAKPDFPVLANKMWYRSCMTFPDLTLQPTLGE